MSEIVSKWIQHRLGLIVDMTPDNFAIKTANGYLLAQILYSYQIIVSEQLKLIVETDLIKQCYENFKHINLWLRDLNITVPDEDLYEVVHGVGTASLHLFYRVFLELKDKTQLDFLTDNEINAQLGNKFTRFQVATVDSKENPNQIDLHSEGLCEPFLAGGDVYHWYKDRIENLQNRCKEARDEYVHLMKSRCKSCGFDNNTRVVESGFVHSRGLNISPRPSTVNMHSSNLPDEIVSYDERTYDELINKQLEAQQMEPVSPDPKEVKNILKNLKQKSKTRHENKLFRSQLHQEIMNEFDRKVTESKLQSEDRVLTRIFLRQSCFEKELVSKMGQVKIQKEYMVENKYQQAVVLNKLKEREFIESIILQDKELDEKKLIFYLERERILELHKKIWEERLRLRAKRHEVLCSNAVKDIVDISIMISDHKKRFGQEPTRRDMNELKDIFISGQPVFNICEPVVNIIKERDGLNDIDEEIITRETLRQNALDHEELDSYMKYCWPWELRNIDSTQSADVFEHISCGLNVLGHIVHQLLLAKYPLPPTRERPYFPECTIRVCVNGLNDITYIPMLRNLLAEREIEVVELTNAVDFCVQSFLRESKREHEEEDIVSIKDIKKKKEKPVKEIKKGEKIKKDKGKSEGAAPDPDQEPKEFDNKTAQTPIIFPCEEIAYSPPALLGQTAQDLLDAGLPLTDYLLTDMFVEYLKSVPNLKGWVLINYPTNYEQAVILEEALTGVCILQPRKITPDENVILEIADIEENDDKDDPPLDRALELKRKSRLLPNPVVNETIKVYDTILTAYIKIKKSVVDEKTGDVILPPVFEELDSEPDPMDKFYSDAGANYSLYYKEFDLNTLKYLGKLIIGDFTLPLKSSVEIFGEGLNYMNLGNGSPKSLRAVKKGEKEKKPRDRLTSSPANTGPGSSDKKTTRESIADKKGKVKGIIVHEDKYTQIPSEDEDGIEEIYISDKDLQIPTPGLEGWEYTVVPCPVDLMVALATLWETIEEIYINDLKQVFFLKRLNINAVMPYVQYVKDIMRKDIDRPDYKGFYLAKFQKAFNVFDMDFRKDDEFKTEMYCRIEDFKEKLVEICDGKMMESEAARCRIINGNWATNQITELFNDYINMFQIEIDRFTESFRLINDYFLGIFVGKPGEDDLWKEDAFPKITEISSEIINVMLQNVDSPVDLSFFESFIANMIHKSNACIKKLTAHISTNIDKIKSTQAMNTPKSKASSPKSKASKDDKKSSQTEVDLVKENHSKLIEEWQCVVKGESLRISLRLDLLKRNTLQTLEDFFGAMRSCFHGIYEDIRTKYRLEITNIENVCNIFYRAVEYERAVQKELIFFKHNFYVNPEVNLYENAPIIPDVCVEPVEDGAFTIKQLSKLSDILMDLSPNGYLLRASFIFFLQDIIWNNPDDGAEPISPKLWGKLDPSSLRRIVDELYDDLEYVYWRDFIIYNMRLKFPTEREMLLTRNNLRECDPDGTELVEDYQFYGTKIWFEYSYKPEDATRIKEAKQLLCKLYYVKNGGVNYTALLLDFCKDAHILIGFAKALELSLGKRICWHSDVGNSFEHEFYQNKLKHEENVRYRDKERAEHYQIAYDEVCKLVDYVVHISEDIIIEDIIEERQRPRTRDRRISYKKVEAEKSKRVSILKKSIDSSKQNSKSDVIKFMDTAEILELSDQQSKPNINTITGNLAVNTSGEIISEDSLIMQLYTNLPDNVYTDASEYTQMVFFLPLDILLTVITASLPWHSRVQMYDELSFCEQAAAIYEEKRNPNFHMSVLAHEFLNSDEFLNHLGKTKKFKAIDPVKLVKQITEGKN